MQELPLNMLMRSFSRHQPRASVAVLMTPSLPGCKTMPTNMKAQTWALPFLLNTVPAQTGLVILIVGLPDCLHQLLV